MVKSDPFGGADCGQEKCYLCLTKSIYLKWKPCWKKNSTYAAYCQRCKVNGIRAEHHGETGKCLFTRVGWHIDKLKSVDSGSFTLRHNLLYHPEEYPLLKNIIWYPEEFHIKPMDRLIAEALNIKNALDTKDHVLMNVKTEYKKCVLPRITPSPTEEEKEDDELIRRNIGRIKT